MTKVAFMLFLNCLNLHATTYEESKFIQFLKESGEKRLLKTFQLSANFYFKEDIKKFYGALDKLIEDKTQKEKNTICDEVVSILMPQSSGEEILKSLRKIEENSTERTIKALGKNFLGKMDEKYLEDSSLVYCKILEDKSKKMMQYGSASIKRIEEALDKQLEVIKEQEDLFQLPKEIQEEDLQVNIQKINQDHALSEQEFHAAIETVYFDHAHHFRAPLLAVANFRGIFDMVEGELEDGKRKEEKNPSISDINVETELDVVLKGVNSELRTWILGRINHAAEDAALLTPTITLFLKNKISGKMVKENPDKGDEIQLKKEFENFLSESILENAAEKPRILKKSILESAADKLPKLPYKSLSNEEHSKILRGIDFEFSALILQKFAKLDGKIDMEQALKRLVENLRIQIKNLEDLSISEDIDVAEIIVNSTVESLCLSEQKGSPFYEEEHVGSKPSKRVKPDT